MSYSSCLPRRLFVVLALLSCLASMALGQEKVFVTGPANEISLANFNALSLDPQVNESGVNFQGLAARADGLLVVANQTQGGGVLACQSGNGCSTVVSLSGAAGVALSPNGDLFAVGGSASAQQVLAVDFDAGCPAGLASSEGCLPGGYDAGSVLVLDGDVGPVDGLSVTELADVRFVPFRAGLLTLGSIAVLSRNPALLFAYEAPAGGFSTCVPDCEPTVIVDHNSFAGLEPTGFAFDTSTGSILVATRDGVIARFDASGTRQPDFAALAGSGSFAKVAVGLVDMGGTAVAKVFATVHNGGRLQRYDVNGVKEAEIDTGVNSPDGVAVDTAGSVVATPAGSNVTVALTGINTTWEQVNLGGSYQALCSTHDDPRPGGGGADLFLCTTGANCASEGDYVIDLGIERVIPSFVRTWKRLLPGDDPLNPTGPHTLRLCIVETEADFSGLVIDESVEEVWLGYDPAHPGEDHVDDPQCLGGPRAFYSTAGLPEGPVFIDASLSCGINLLGSWQRSFLLPTVSDDRCLDGAGDVQSAGQCTASDGAIDCKLAILSSLVDEGASCVSKRLGGELGRSLASAIRNFDRGRYTRALSDVEGLRQSIEANNGAFSQCADPRLGTQLRARLQSVEFLLGVLIDEGDLPDC